MIDLSAQILFASSSSQLSSPCLSNWLGAVQSYPFLACPFPPAVQILLLWNIHSLSINWQKKHIFFYFECPCAVNVVGHYEINPWKSLNGAISRILNDPLQKMETFRGTQDFFGPRLSISSLQGHGGWHRWPKVDLGAFMINLLLLTNKPWRLTMET